MNCEFEKNCVVAIGQCWHSKKLHEEEHCRPILKRGAGIDLIHNMRVNLR